MSEPAPLKAYQVRELERIRLRTIERARFRREWGQVGVDGADEGQFDGEAHWDAVSAMMADMGDMPGNEG